jgi:RES domain
VSVEFVTQRYAATVWRVVEAQHKIATSRLVARNDDQALLESLVEEVKPLMPALCRSWPYLLQTPFRYGHNSSSRFRRAGARPGIFYASEHVATALAETGYWRLRFFAHLPPGDWPTAASLHHSFYVKVKSDHSLDLMQAPYSQDKARWMHPNDYSACQQLAQDARAADVELIRYTSVRDPEQRANIALLAPEPLIGAEPVLDQTWQLQIEPGRALFTAAFPAQDRHNFSFA